MQPREDTRGGGVWGAKYTFSCNNAYTVEHTFTSFSSSRDFSYLR